MQKSPISWDDYFMGLAKCVSAKSKDPNTKVGAVVVDSDKKVVSTGYNGFPARLDEFKSRWKKDSKKDYVIHAEENCLLFANCDLSGCTMYISHPICMRCAVRVIQSKIDQVVMPGVMVNPDSSHRYDLAVKTLQSAGVKVSLDRKIRQ